MPTTTPKRPASSKPVFSRGPAIGVGAALALTFGLVLAGPNAVGGRTEAPSGQVLAERMLTFADTPTHAVAVAENGHLVTTFEGEQGFLRGILRGLNRTRKINQQPYDAPYRLAAYADGRLVLEDPSTGVRLDLAAYGFTNEAVFAHLLPIDARMTPGAAHDTAS